MNTTTQVESRALSLPQRAAVALGSSKTEVDLRELVKKSADIVEVNNMAGRDQAHRIGMDLKTARVTIEKTGKTAREDAQAFSKAVIAEEKRLVEIITPEEDRVFALRDGWDTKVENERQAKIAAEAQRMADIAQQLQCIRDRETHVLRGCKTAAETQLMIEELEYLAVVAGNFQERLAEAVALKSTVLESMRTVLAGRVAAEAAEVARLAAAKAEAERLEAERAELVKLRAEAAERERLAKIESDRIAAEQAAEAKRLAALAAAQEAEARVKAESAAADLRAQLAAQEAKARAEQAERERVAAGVRAQLEQQAAALAADRKALEDERAADAKAKADALATAEAAKAPVEVERTAIGQILHDGLQRRNSALAEQAMSEQGTDSAPPAATWPFSSQAEHDAAALQEAGRTYGAPTLRLGQITERLGFALTAEFLRTLGFEPADRNKGAVLYHEFQFSHICAALHRHIRDVCEKLAEAA